MKARSIYTAPKKAEEIFTDREEPRRAFWAVYERVCSDPGSVEAIGYYGVGGIGKSSLLFQLIRELGAQAPRSPGVYYSFELSGRSKEDCLYFMAECLMQQCKGLKFPLFGTALLQLNQMVGRDVSVLEKKMTHTLLDRVDVDAVLNLASALIPNFNAARTALQEGLKLFRHIKNDYDYNQGPNAAIYHEIEGSSAADLLHNLHRYFCMDAASWLERQSPPVVMMLDGYEVLTNTLERGDLAEVEDTWLWGSEGMIWSLPNTLWVIAGRNRLMWDRYDSELRDSLEQHLLGNISEMDTADFLSRSGVREEALYSGIYQLTGGTPVYLDMCVNTYRQLKALRGEDCIPSIDEFGSTPTDLAERFLRGMNSDHQRMVKLIACLPTNWTNDLAVAAAKSACYDNIRGPFEDICKLSLVEKDGNRCKLHSTLRAVVRKFMQEDERKRLDNAVFGLLLARMEDPAFCVEHEDYTAWAVELLAREDGGVDAGKEQLKVVFDAADVCNSKGDYRTFREYVQQITEYVMTRSCGEEAVALCRDNQFKALLNLGRYREALEPGQEACDIHLHLYGADHPDTLYSLNNLAIGYNKLGDWQKALELTKTVYEGRRRIYGEDHESTMGSLNNMAIYSVMLGNYKNAAELMQQSYEAMLRLQGSEHPHTIICQNNLAAIYQKLGEYRKATEILQQVYETQLRTLGEEHPDILFGMFNLAVGYGDIGEYEQALQLAQKAYDAHLRILGEEHPDSLSALNYLGECYLNLGEITRARELVQCALDGRLALLGEEHPDVAESRKLLKKCK